MNYDSWRSQLEPYLQRWETDNESRWNDLVGRLRRGDIVTGKVIVKAHFGAWIDINVGFPALIELPYIRGLTHERYIADDWCPIGSPIITRVIGWETSSPMRQIRLAQVRPIFSTITSEERQRLTSLFSDIRSLEEVITKFGLPDQDLPKGRISFNRQDEAKYDRLLVYKSLSDSARITVFDDGTAALEIRIDTKHVGEEECVLTDVTL